jgi:predicted O-methyltransferase YrrM
MKGPFDFWNENAFLEYQNDDVRIYDMDAQKYLFIGQIMYASTSERGWYVKNVMPYATGKCLEIGLGLGVASKSMLVKNEVRHLLTIESNEKVIEAFGRPLRNHNILHANIYDWAENLEFYEPVYDFIFVDHYTLDDEEIIEPLEDLAAQLRKLLKPDGKMVFWIDTNATDEDQQRIKDLWVI